RDRRAVTIPALIHLGLVSRMKVDVGSDDLLGVMDGRCALEADAEQQDEGVIIPHQPVRTVGRHRRVVDVVAAEQCGSGRSDRGDGRRLAIHRSPFLALMSSMRSRHRSTSRNGSPLRSSSSRSHQRTRRRRSIVFSGKRSRLTEAGTPATIANGGTSFVTTEPAPMIAPSPTETPPMMLTLWPVHTSLPIATDWNMSGVRARRV